MNSVNTLCLRIRALAVMWLSLSFASLAVAAPSPDGLWDDADERTIARTPVARQIVPERYRAIELDLKGLERLLQSVPQERAVSVRQSDASLWLPLPQGGFSEFQIVESPIMEPALASRYPDIRTWVGQGIDDPTATLRFDLTPKGFHAQILSANGTLFIDPFQPGDRENYIAYRKQDHKHGEVIRCSVTGADIAKESPAEHLAHADTKLSSGGTLRTYRLAMAATGEYTAFHGGSVADGLAGIVSTVNRVTGIYEREVSVRFVLVGNNDRIIYTNAATDPYANSSGDLAANISTINAEIGLANYDVGHLVGTGGGGVAGLGVICTSNKARGLTGSGSPVGDSFDVDYVAHEMGHQFGGSHTFNGSGGNCAGGNRSATSAYEPGSGITIQAYAGICATDNVQPNSDDYFHRRSLNQMIEHSTTGSGGSCGATNLTGNAIPVVTTAGAFTIPHSTPFELEAVATDADAGDALTYVWEQFDLGAANAAGVLDPAVAGPLFRSFAPTPRSNRIFPSLRYILGQGNVPPATSPLEGTTSPSWFTAERLPSTSRVMNFRVTVRDNRAAGGGTNEATTALTVDQAAGPFAVAGPNGGETWAAGSPQTVTWNVAGTGAVPFATQVRITLSLDGGYTWPIELAASVLNNGSASVTLPAGTPSTSQARVRVKAVGNVFFDVSNADFSITGTNSPPTISGSGSVTTRQGSPTATGIVRTINDQQDGPANLTVAVAELPEGLVATATNLGGQVSLFATASCGLAAPTGGAATRAYPVRLDVTDSGGATTSSFVNVNVGSNLAPTLGTYTSLAVGRGTTTPFAPSAGPADPNGNVGAVSVSPTVLPGGGTISVAPDGTVTASTTAGTTFGTYPIRIQLLDSCGAAEVREFALTVASTEPVLDLTATTVTTGNGLIEPNECNQVSMTLTNTGTVTATGVSATVSTATPNVTLTQPVAAFADIPPGQSRTSLSTFEVSTEGALVCFSSIDLSLSVTYGGGGSPYLDTTSLTAGQPAAANYVFDASSGATIPSGGTLIAGSNIDDGLFNVTVPAGFSFPLYGATISGGTILRVSTNGTLQFASSGGSRQYDNGALPSTGSGNFGGESFPAAAPVMMPFWDDLTLAVSGGGIYTHELGTAPNRQWLVEWRGQQYEQTPTGINARFAIVLTEGSAQFEYVYAQTAAGASIDGASATVGVQAASSGTSFSQFSLNNSVITAGTRLTASRPAAICNSGSGTCATGPRVLLTQTDDATGVTEAGATDSYTLVLGTSPSADVTIALATDADVVVSPSNFLFTAADWDSPRTVTVTAINDRTVEGAHAGTITHTVSGGDYGSVTVPNVVANIVDNDSATYQFASASSSASEAAGTINLSVGLTLVTSGGGTPELEAAITIPVTVGAGSTATGGGVDYTLGVTNVVIPTSGTAQNVPVTLVAGATAEPSETLILNLGSETGGSAAQQAVVASAAPASHTLTITDVNSAAVTVAASGGVSEVAEGGADDTYTLVLTSEPTADVTITITPDVELTVNPTSVTFTAGNWNSPRLVTINAVDDADVEGDHSGLITHSAAGGSYTGVPVASLDVDVTDNDLSADLAVSNDLVPGTVVPGQPVSFEVTINNLSALIDVASAAFDFSLVPTLTNVTWTCTADVGASCSANGTGLPSHSVSLDAGTGVLYRITADVAADAQIGATITATAQISVAVPYTDPNGSNNQDTATATVDDFPVFANGFEGN